MAKCLLLTLIFPIDSSGHCTTGSVTGPKGDPTFTEFILFTRQTPLGRARSHLTQCRGRTCSFYFVPGRGARISVDHYSQMRRSPEPSLPAAIFGHRQCKVGRTISNRLARKLLTIAFSKGFEGRGEIKDYRDRRRKIPGRLHESSGPPIWNWKLPSNPGIPPPSGLI